MENLEIWYGKVERCEHCDVEVIEDAEEFEHYGNCDETTEVLTGYYYWFCFPGCLPESGPIGPFESYEEAKEDAEELFDIYY